MSVYLLAIALAWVIAQGSKFLLAAVVHQSSTSLRQLYASGSMPSSHSAIVIAMMTMVGLKDGVDGALFGLSVLLAAIVMYDAVMVRRSSGEQGVALRALIVEQKSAIQQPRAAKGHEPLEVAVGALVGLATSLFIFFLIR